MRADLEAQGQMGQVFRAGGVGVDRRDGRWTMPREEMIMAVKKVLVMFGKRPDITREQFRAHYEGVHVPLVNKLLPFFADYRRNYINRDDSVYDGAEDTCKYDVVTELWFASLADYDNFTEALKDPAVFGALTECEAAFLDPSTMVTYVVDEVSKAAA
jgi:uncharacterized protein (TIGR02118 family)